jgi:hypothetical protein
MSRTPSNTKIRSPQPELTYAKVVLTVRLAENPQYKAMSMLARLRGVVRHHVALGLNFVSLATVVIAAQGLVQEAIDEEGPEAVMPKSREPFDTSEIVGMLRLPTGTRIVAGGHDVTVGDNLEWQGIVVFINLYATGGWRKEAIALGVDEAFGHRKLSLWHVTHLLGGTLRRAPSPAQLRGATWGDVTYVTPCPCKNDMDGTKYMNSPVPSVWHPTRPINLSRELIKYELMRGVAPELRRRAPLVLGPAGLSWTKTGLDAFFKALVSRVVSKARAKQLSVHSFRVWLACALLAAGATPEQIMLLLRWSSDAARKLYAQLGQGVQSSLLNSATDVPLDTIRGHTMLAMPATGAPTEDEQRQRRAGDTLRQAAALADAAQDHAGPLPSRTELPVPIDEWAAVIGVHADAENLERMARAADEEAERRVASYEPDDDDD